MRRPIGGAGGVGTSMNGKSSISSRTMPRSSPPSQRRKGTSLRRKKSSIVLNDHALFVFLAICLGVFLIGIMIGSRGLPSHNMSASNVIQPGHFSPEEVKNFIRQEVVAENQLKGGDPMLRGNNNNNNNSDGQNVENPNQPKAPTPNGEKQSGAGSMAESKELPKHISAPKETTAVNAKQNTNNNANVQPNAPKLDAPKLPPETPLLKDTPNTSANNQNPAGGNNDKLPPNNSNAVANMLQQKGVRHRNLNMGAGQVQVVHKPAEPPLDPSGTGGYEERFSDETRSIRNGQEKPTREFPYLGQPVPKGMSFDKYERKGGGRFLEYAKGASPYIITAAIRQKSDEVARTRREYVKNAMIHLWNGYKQEAFGHDEVKPCEGGYNDRWGGIGTTLVDSLDTLWLMGLKDEFWEARDWVRDKLQHTTTSKPVSTFETTIRSLGGLLSAYDWSGDRAFLDKADDLASRLFRAFQTQSGLPSGQINLGTGKVGNGKGVCVLAEAGTIQLEFRYIAKATATPEYASKAERVFTILNDLAPAQGLYPLNIKCHVPNPSFYGGKISFGAMGDSAYEYMLKTWLQGGRKEDMYRAMYDKSIQGLHDELLHKSNPSNLVYAAEKNGNRIFHKMDHLSCFLGGTLALGAYTDPRGLDSLRAQRDLRTAKSLAYTCYQMYARTVTGLAPESINIAAGADFNIPRNSVFYILRPETIETFYYLSRLTGDPMYREWGWEIFQCLERRSKTNIAYMHIKDVNTDVKQLDDHMESFFPAETLKYFYLLFDPDSEVDILNKHVFNTEAHPVRIFEGLDKDGEFQATAQTFAMPEAQGKDRKREIDMLLSEARENLKKGQHKTRNKVPEPPILKEDPPTAANAVTMVPDGKYEDRFANEAKLIKEGAPTPEKAFPHLGSSIPKEHDFSTFAPSGGGRFAEYKDGGTPYLITKDIRDQSDALARERRDFIKAAMQHTWKGYKNYAMGHDDILPVRDHSASKGEGIGTTLVDSLDTLWLMGMKDEFWEGRDWVRDHLDYSRAGYQSTFETTIRSLGGLLAAYDLSGDAGFLEKADDLASRLYRAFGTESGIAFGEVNLGTREARNIQWLKDQTMIAEAGTLQVEFRYIGVATNTLDYATYSEKVFLFLNDINPQNGLLPVRLRNKSKNPAFSMNKITFGATGDSVYEYMLKIWLQGGKVENMYRDMYDKAIQGLHDKLLQKSSPNGLVFVADLNNGRLDLKMDHLVCYLGGTLALGAYTDPQGFESFRAQRDLRTAKALAYTCYQMYARTPTGLSPEYAKFVNDRDMIVPSNAPFYLLRPEALEGFYYLNQLTGDPIYREWGWEIFQAIEKHCKTAVAYAAYRNVESISAGLDNKMESFFPAETLKYLYLLMDPDSEIDILHKHVFNTEAHPLRMFNLLKNDAKFKEVAEKYLVDDPAETADSDVKKVS